MTKYKIAVEWACYGTVNIEAESLEEAMIIAGNDLNDIPLPLGSYIDGSWLINEDIECQKLLNSL